ncbi:SigE family RNA polymerase sigma factor [Pengzhenrongella phosphoraccumulans]|uniref:SigE family RNA polymerase sigma factor n=1 Tax=Pengzhenrongella phosphoraccumulans TaxID=3114394 RepID=UPI00388F7D03
MDPAEDFRGFVVDRQRALLRTAWLLTGNWSAAEDLVQAALIRAWPHWERVGGGVAAYAYVRQVMVNLSIDWRHRRWRGEVPTEHLPDVMRAAGTDLDLQQVLVGAVRALPPRQRAVVVLRYFDDLSEIDTAAAMGCTVGTVKSQTSKALATLRGKPDLVDLQLLGSAL